jgi:hypothetical protein
VGNPSLCPAFRVRRGKRFSFGLMTSRARRATRPTPSEFRCHVGMAPTSAAGSVPRDTLPTASPCASPLPRPSLGTRSESGGDADRTDGFGRGAQGRDRKQCRRARTYDQVHPVSGKLQLIEFSTAARSWAIGRPLARPLGRRAGNRDERAKAGRDQIVSSNAPY